MLKKAFLATLFSVSSPTFAINDIAGVQVGLPLAEQKTSIERINPEYQLEDIKTTSGKIVGLSATARKDGRITDQFFAVQDDEGIVWFIGRAQKLNRGARIKPDTMLASLTEKYGPYTEAPIGNDGPNWQFERQGTLFQGDGKSGPCYKDITMGAATPISKVPGTAIEVPQVFSATCGLAIKASISKDPVDGMVSAFSVQVVDIRYMHDMVHSRAENNAKERQRQLATERAKDNKPQL